MKGNLDDFLEKKSKTRKLNREKMIPKIKRKKTVQTVQIPIVKPAYDYDELGVYEFVKCMELRDKNLRFGHAEVFKVGEKIIGLGDFDHCNNDYSIVQPFTVKDIIHNILQLAKILREKKSINHVGKDYDEGVYEYKISKKDMEKKFREMLEYNKIYRKYEYYKFYEVVQSEHGETIQYCDITKNVDIFMVNVEWD